MMLNKKSLFEKSNEEFNKMHNEFNELSMLNKNKTTEIKKAINDRVHSHKEKLSDKRSQFKFIRNK